MPRAAARRSAGAAGVPAVPGLEDGRCSRRPPPFGSRQSPLLCTPAPSASLGGRSWPVSVSVQAAAERGLRAPPARVSRHRHALRPRPLQPRRRHRPRQSSRPAFPSGPQGPPTISTSPRPPSIHWHSTLRARTPWTCLSPRIDVWRRRPQGTAKLPMKAEPSSQSSRTAYASRLIDRLDVRSSISKTTFCRLSPRTPREVGAAR
jgi:hypothetical protein